MPYRVGDRMFSTKADVLAEAMAIRDRLGVGGDAQGDDYDFLLDLLGFHPRAETKIGPGLAAIYVRPNRFGTVSFGLMRQDGTHDDFSCYKCVTALTKALRP